MLLLFVAPPIYRALLSNFSSHDRDAMWARCDPRTRCRRPRISNAENGPRVTGELCKVFIKHECQAFSYVPIETVEKLKALSAQTDTPRVGCYGKRCNCYSKSTRMP